MGWFMSQAFGSDELTPYTAEYAWNSNQMSHAMMGFALAIVWILLAISLRPSALPAVPKSAEEGSAVLRVVREKASELMGREPPAALLLLHDLRHLYLQASGNAVLWTMVLQAARSSQQTELADAAFLSLARTQRQVTWCKSTIKVLSPQALAAV